MGFSKKFLIISFIALLLRIGVAFWSLGFRENTDILRYKDWARIAYLYNFAETYKSNHITFGTLPNNQPPGSLYILSGSYWLELQSAKVILRLTHTAPGNNLWVNGPMMTLFLRFPSIIADIFLGSIIYFFIKKRKTEKAALIGSALFLFSPPIWYNSAFWGQMDSVNNLPFFAGILLLFNKKYFLSALFVFVSLFIKLSLLPGILLFFVLFFIYKKKKKWQFMPIITFCIGIIFLLTIPVAGGNLLWYIDFMQKNSRGEMQNITNFAFNFWWFVFRPTVEIGSPANLFSFSQISMQNISPVNIKFLGFNINQLAIGLFYVISFPFIIILFRLRKYLTVEMGILALSITLLLSFIFLPTMHERYMYPVFPFLALYIGMTNKYFFSFILLSVLSFFNLYIVWHPMMLALLPYALIANSTFQWLISAGTIGVTIYLYISSIRTLIHYEKK